MAKVTVHHEPTPSQAIVQAASQPSSVTTASGRVIGVKKIGPLDRLKLFEVVGPENSKNEAYLGYASLAFHVTSIDGEPVPRPTSRLQLEALIQRLDDDGLDAVGAELARRFGGQEGGEELLKNGSGTPS